MKLFALIFLLTLSTTSLFSQHLTDEIITGSWSVTDCKINFKLVPDSLDPAKQKMMEQMRRSFIGAVYTFKADKEFTITFSDKYPEFTKELEFLNHRQWKIGEGDIIVIGSKEDNYSLMKIFSGSKDGKNYFILDETPFMLVVVKI